MLSSVNTESIKTENFHSIALPTEVPTLLPNFTPTPKCLVQVLTSERGPDFIWYQSGPDEKLSLIGITLAVLTAVLEEIVGPDLGPQCCL